jgi:hypothetical protein
MRARRQVTLVVLLAAPAAAMACGLFHRGVRDPIAPPQQSPAPGREAEAYRHFQHEIAEYMEARARAAATVPSVAAGEGGAAITARQRALAAAIRRARGRAKPGEIFDAEAGPVIAGVVREELARDAEERRKVQRENPRAETPNAPVRLAVDAEYDPAASVSTVPPGLLLRLPPLPKELEYRFVGPHLILYDVDANTVVDYLRSVVP